MPDGKRETVSAKVAPATLAAIDAARGSVSRSAWLERVIADRLADPGAPPIRQRVQAIPGQSRQSRDRRSAGVPAARFSDPEVDALAPPGPVQAAACKHRHVLKGWCRDCKTGGHF